MNHDQLLAWFALEGWELRRRPGTIGPTMTNPGRGLWISHHYVKIEPFSEYTTLSGAHIKDCPTVDWSTIEAHYLEAALKTLGVSYEP